LVTVQLPGELAARLDEFMRAEGLLGKSTLASGVARQCRFLNKISETGRRGEEVVHQFHPLIRFISRDLQQRNEHFYPLIAARAEARLTNNSVAPGRYAFYVRSWIFKGVRDEEYLSAVALDLESGQILGEDDADRLLQAARLAGDDWIQAGVSVPPDMVVQRLEEAEDELDRRYKEAKQRKQNENSDRARFQLDSIDRHLARRMPRLLETLETHLARGRKPLAAATQGQIDKLKARMNARKERISNQERVTSDKHFICAGVIEVI
jgi:hypothetical protein